MPIPFLTQGVSEPNNFSGQVDHFLSLLKGFLGEAKWEGTFEVVV